MSKEKEKKYVDYLEKSGYMVFNNIKELKQIVLETIDYDDLIQEIIKRHNGGDNDSSDCGCGN